MGYYDKERVRGFLHNQDGIIVNDFGEEVILRGWGMGNWDNPEGFMLGTQSGFGLFEPGKYAPMGRMDRGRSMDQILRETCGTKYAEEFWKRWRRLYLTEEDIALLSRRGYNSVRLPIRAGSFLYEEPGITYNEDSFAMLNDVLDWCETYQVYAVVDFHAATAGQSGIPCDDGVDNGQHLYDDEESMERMFLLMEEFMRRYKDRWYQRADLHDAAPRGADTEAGLFLRGNDPPLQKDRPETLIFAEWYTVFLSYIFL